MKKALLLIVLALFGLCSCESMTGKEILRLSMKKVNEPVTSSADLKKGDKLNIWLDLDLKYSSDNEYEFRVLTMKNNDSIWYDKLHPGQAKVSLKSSEVTLGGETTYSVMCKVGYYSIEEDGTYSFSAWLAAEDSADMKIEKADLVLKQK